MALPQAEVKIGRRIHAREATSRWTRSVIVSWGRGVESDGWLSPSHRRQVVRILISVRVRVSHKELGVIARHYGFVMANFNLARRNDPVFGRDIRFRAWSQPAI